MEDARRFGWVDYLLFALTLMVSSLVGVYHAWKGASDSTSNYLMGGKKMGIFPIAMSLAASSISATTLLGTPAEVYLTGIMYLWIVGGNIIGTPIAAYLYLPVFHRLQVLSANHYLELRFNSLVRRTASVLYIIKQLFYQTIVVYGPSLALTQVTGINVYISVSLMFAVCTFYTSIGGIKAVVWTDTMQICLMYGSIVTVLIRGIADVGGIETVWQRNSNSTRIEVDADWDPTVRHTVWSLVIGGAFYWGGWNATDQTTVQRFLAMPTLRKAQTAMNANVFAACGIIVLSCFAGLVVYARYFDCDPLAAQMILKADQIVPHFVMDTVGRFPGLSGLFVAGVFSGALSTLSSGLNAVALVVLEDFIRPFHPNLDDKTATRLTKGVSLLFGCISFGAVFLIANVKTILDATLSFNGAVAGALLGVFTLGLFVPWANATGAGVGLVTSFVSMMALGVCTQIARSNGRLRNHQMKPLSVENCPAANATLFTVGGLAQEEQEEVFVLLRISYLWYTLIGTVIVLVLGTAVSFLSRAQDPAQLEPNLVCSIIRKRVGSERGPRNESRGEILLLS